MALSHLRLFEVPAELDALDERVHELSELKLPAETDPNYQTAFEAQATMSAALEQRFAELGARLSELGAGYHAWLRRLRADAEAAKAEEERVRDLRKVREGKLERVKTYVRDTLIQAQLPKLEGPSWRLRVQANGGVKPIKWVSAEPVPPALAGKVAISPAALVEAARSMAEASSLFKTDTALVSDEEILAYFTQEPLVFSAERAWAVIKAAGGEVPEGVEVLEAGKHLRVE